MNRPPLSHRSIRMITRVSLAACLGFSFALVACTAGVPEPSDTQLNILVITVDDMGWDSVGAFGSAVDGATPRIDALAASGLRFEHAHVPISICQPSRAAMLTARVPHRSGAMGFEAISSGVETLPERLRAEGWYTGLLAKGSHTIPSRPGAWDAIVPATSLNGGREPDLFHAETTRLVAAAKETGKPFFLLANIEDPHVPYAGTREELNAARHGTRGLSGTPPPVSRRFTPDEIEVPPFLPHLPSVRQSVADYYTSVHRADESVGRILAALDDAGLTDTTLVVFLSDNGMHFPFAKANVYLASTRTPLIVRWPGVSRAGSTDNRHVLSTIDLAPTLLEAAGLAPMEDIDGRSFLPLLEGRPQADRDYAFTYFNSTIDGGQYPMRGVTGRSFGYVFNAWSDGRTRYRNRTAGSRAAKAMKAAAATDPAIAARLSHFELRTPEELYDYASDPGALVDLAAEPVLAAWLAEARGQLLREMRRTDDPLLGAYEARLDAASRTAP